MSLICKNKKKKVSDYSFLGVDMHNHILPGIDDGASSIQDSLILMEGLYNLGFSKIIPTPHIIETIYPNSEYTISDSFNKLTSNIEFVKLELPQLHFFSAEYYLDINFTHLRKNNQLISFGDKNVLIEMSYLNISQNLEEEIYQLQLLGYQPILAHPERYNYLHNNKNYFTKLVGMGCHLQLNLLSLINHYGKNTRKTAEYLLDQELYHWAGTDVHNLNHINFLYELLTDKIIYKILEYPFYNKSLL